MYGIEQGDSAAAFVDRLILRQVDHLASLGFLARAGTALKVLSSNAFLAPLKFHLKDVSCLSPRNWRAKQGTNAGFILAKYCLRIGSMENVVKALKGSSKNCDMPCLLMLLGKSDELSKLRLRRDEKKYLKELQQSAIEGKRQRIRFPRTHKLSSLRCSIVLSFSHRSPSLHFPSLVSSD